MLRDFAGVDVACHRAELVADSVSAPSATAERPSRPNATA
jgi:hypothetical protein